MDVSVVVPVYNASRYLPQCVETLINQTLRDIEFIFVDDGSTDDSYEILKKYQEKDERIKILRQENLHAGVAHLADGFQDRIVLSNHRRGTADFLAYNGHFPEEGIGIQGGQLVFIGRTVSRKDIHGPAVNRVHVDTFVPFAENDLSAVVKGNRQRNDARRYGFLNQKVFRRSTAVLFGHGTDRPVFLQLCQEAFFLFSAGGLLFLTREQTKRMPESNCIRCGKCADACPMGLEPFLLNRLYKAGDTDALEANAVQDCIMCGCCLYSCPAGIPLLDVISQARGQVMGIMRARAAAAKAAAEAAKAAAEAANSTAGSTTVK